MIFQLQYLYSFIWRANTNNTTHRMMSRRGTSQVHRATRPLTSPPPLTKGPSQHSRREMLVMIPKIDVYHMSHSIGLQRDKNQVT
jgi:hypothetical protein